MNATEPKTSALPALGVLFEYPGERFQAQYDEAVEAVRAVECGAEAALGAFQAELSGLSTAYAQELYTRTFDLSPVCVPYVSVHLFGAESFKRAELMTGLIAAYERAGFERGTELPDHIALLLRSAPGFNADEWEDLAAFVLLPALEKMGDALNGAKSPWRHVVRAVQGVLTLGDERDGC